MYDERLVELAESCDFGCFNPKFVRNSAIGYTY